MNKKVLVIYAHPDTDGYNKQILKSTEKFLKKEKIDFKVLDLYKMKYNPVLDKDEIYVKGKNPLKDTLEIQKEIIERDQYIFIYPVWWGSMPAILKGFSDRVFSAGFAFKYVNSMPVGLLKGKKAFVFTTTGAPRIYNFLTCNRVVKALTRNILSFCGIKSKYYVFSKALNIDKDRKTVDKKVKEKLKSFF